MTKQKTGRLRAQDDPERQLTTATELVEFVREDLLPGTGVSPDRFWAGLFRAVATFTPRIRQALATRVRLQDEIDQWHQMHRGVEYDQEAYEQFLRAVGYLVDDAGLTSLRTDRIDPEISSVSAPQLVVPGTNARYALNAANARWGSLYDALYGTDALGTPPPQDDQYDPGRGSHVIARGRQFLDNHFPLDGGGHSDVVAYWIDDGSLAVTLRSGTEAALESSAQFQGYRGDPTAPTAIVLRHHGLLVEIQIDREHPVGQGDAAGVADIQLESAVTTIVDFEDSVATVDLADKLRAYKNWLGLMRGDLNASVTKQGQCFTRSLAPDRHFWGPTGAPVRGSGRALLLVRVVGLHLTTEAVLDAGGAEIPETLLDCFVAVAAGVHDLVGNGVHQNSSEGSVYVVVPKLHGPAEVELVTDLLAHVEDILMIPHGTIKVGLMDEERRTSANLGECMRAARERLAFINTGFLDRTGSEIRTSTLAGPMVPKSEMASQPWMTAYEDRNVDMGLQFGLHDRGQIGKGMWAAPDLMAQMLTEKVGHPEAGASCAWVPSPTAATLHALHYHEVDVAARQEQLSRRALAPLSDLLTIPLWTGEKPPDDGRRIKELETNIQSILGYAVRWIDQGVGCSKVPDRGGTDLMEDRATCRISAQHVANWLRHGWTTRSEVLEIFRRIAAEVDQQNAVDPAYRPMTPECDGVAFRGAVDLVLKAEEDPSGYTEPVLYPRRRDRKAIDIAAMPGLG